MVGWRGVVPRLWARYLPFRGVRRLVGVRPMVNGPCFGAMVRFGVPCCAALCCGAPCSDVPCHAVLCRGVSRRGAACFAVLCRTVLCRAVLCRALLCCVVVCHVAVSCSVVPCAAVCRAASCCAIICCAVLCSGSIVPPVGRGVVSALVGLVALLCGTRADVMWLADGRGAWLGVVRLAGSVLWGSGCAVHPGGSVGCPQGCPPLGPVPWSCVLWGPLSLGVCWVLWGGVGWSLCLLVAPRPWCCSGLPFPPAPVPLHPCGGHCCGQGHRLTVRVRWWVVRCSRRLPVWMYPLPPVWVYPPYPVRGVVVRGRGPVWFVRCRVRVAAVRLGGLAPPGWSAWWLGVAMSVQGRGASTGWGAGALLVPLAWLAPLSWLVSWCPSLRPVPQCNGPWPFLFPVLVVLQWFLPPVLCCPWCPVTVGACLLPGASPRPLAAGLPFALSYCGVLGLGWW